MENKLKSMTFLRRNSGFSTVWFASYIIYKNNVIYTSQPRNGAIPIHFFG